MSLAELQIQNLRCIEAASLEFSPDFNLISGENGAGKTSILEAIFLLGRGRSFRTRSSERLIRHGSDSLTVFGRTGNSPPWSAGVEVSREGTRARINGENAQSLLELTGVFPVQALDPEIHKLIDQGPERRRRWLDWLVFHVEPTFGMQWARYQRALKQRNAALKIPGTDFSAWDPALIEHGEAITRARQATLDRLDPYLQSLFAAFSGLRISVGFHAGWGHDYTLQEALKVAHDRDRERGTSTSGPHRADVILRTTGRSARETLSRGQQKLTAVAMIIAQLQLLKAEHATRSVLLLDDPAAELDTQNLQRLFKELDALDCQMIATSLHVDKQVFRPAKAMFHVEHGRVKRV
jgi:DNA replication and repair protein RecF